MFFPIVFHHVLSWGDPDTVLQLIMLKLIYMSLSMSERSNLDP